ncbi:MAG: CCDC90 family protein [Magnetococcus sp. YQC-3]
MSTPPTTETNHKSSSFLFDSYSYVRRLRDAGMDEQQAAIQAEAFVLLAEDRLATKQDIAELQREIASVKTDLHREIASVKTDLQREIAAMNAKVETIKAELRAEIEIAKNETIKWMVGLALAQLAMMAGILTTLVRVLPGGH